MKLLVAKTLILFRTHPFESLFFLPLLLFYGWYLLALSGLFSIELVLFLFLGVFVLSVFLLGRRPAFCSFSNVVLALFLFALAFFAFTTHPIEPVAEGRDQGTFLNSALLLAEHQGLRFQVEEARPFFEIYGPGKALNFPGFAYVQDGSLTPEFPLGYIVWLGGFVTIFGLGGLTIANGLLYILSGVLFSTILKRVLPAWAAFFAALIFMGGFIPLWFLSFTLTENLALFLFLLVAETTMRYRITKDPVTLFLIFSCAFALALTRIEGWAILVITFLIVSGGRMVKRWTTTTLLQKPRIPLSFLAVGILIALFTVLLNSPYYEAIAKELLKSAGKNITSPSFDKELLPLYLVFFKYGILLPLVGGLLGSVYLWKTKRTILLYPFFLSVAVLPYLFLPHITFDAPWMLRRFHFALYPALFLSFCFVVGIFIHRLEENKRNIAWGFFLLILFGLQVPLAIRYVDTNYQPTLLPQVQALSRQFTPSDLLLVDKDVTGDNFMMPNRTLSYFYDRRAVYFFNPEDYQKIRTENFQRVFLIVPETKREVYSSLEGNFKNVREFTFTNDHSFRSVRSSDDILPQRNDLVTKNLIIELQ